LLGSALNEQGGGASLRLGRGGIPPTPPFRRALASASDFFGWLIENLAQKIQSQQGIDYSEYPRN